MPTIAVSVKPLTATEVDDIYLAIHKEQRGPFSAAKVRAMLYERQITPKALFWRAGMTSWEPLDEHLEKL